jgi:hypothetical protein
MAIARDLIGDREFNPNDPGLTRMYRSLEVQRRHAAEAHAVFGAKFADSLYSIKRFLEGPRLGAGECLESFDPGWAFTHFTIYWRHLAGRKRPVCYLPLRMPQPRAGVEVVNATPEIISALGPDAGLQSKDLVICVKPDPKAPGIAHAKRHAERMRHDYGEDEPAARWLR